jgi:hypothetical protein
MPANINYRYPTEYRNLAISTVPAVIVLVLNDTVTSSPFPTPASQAFD